jgi:putative heme transporter
VPRGGADRREPVRLSPSLPAEALGAPPGPRSVFFKVASAALSGGLIVLLFVAVIPKLADFSDVRSALSSMSPGTILLLLLGAVVIRLLLAAAYMVLLPGLSLVRSLIAREASSAVSNVIPGPSGTASQFVILRSWGVGAEDFARATVGVSVVTNVLIFAMPGVAFVGWALLGMPAAGDSDNSWIAGLIAVLLSVVSVGIVAAVGSSVRLAGLVGRVGQSCVNPVRRVMHKPPLTNWPDHTIALRAETAEQLRDRGAPLLSYVLGGYVLNGLLLVGSIWACGVSRTELPLSLGLMLYAVGRLSTVVSITPGGVGVVELVYTAVYVAVLGETAQDSVVAGVLLYRALTYLLPIITGAVAYVVWRVMQHRARRGELADA